MKKQRLILTALIALSLNAVAKDDLTTVKDGCEHNGKVSKVGAIVTIPLENGELLTTVCAQLATSEYLGNRTNKLINESFVWVKLSVFNK